MDFQQIQDLIKLVSESNLGEVSIEQSDFKIAIKHKEEKVTQVVAAAVQQAPVASLPQSYAPQAQPQQAPAPAAGGAAETASNLITIKSPMIGTFYRRPSPDKPNFVEIGDDINPGKVVCIIEAMKLFNEIESEISGKIVKILVEDASPVEYDQPLFLVEPA